MKRIIIFGIVCSVFLFMLDDKRIFVTAKYFDYPRYYYKKKPKMESKFKFAKNKCLKTAGCERNGLIGLDLIKCWRKCIAPDCYEEIYGFDELEEGEVDVRGNSFKGCWMLTLPKINRIDL